MTEEKQPEEENKSNANGKKKAEQEERISVSDEELVETKDRLLRLAAEFDNYKKRSAKEMDGARDLGKAELMKALLPTLDEFELAVYALNGSENGKSNVKGIELVFSNVFDTLKHAGLKQIEAKGRYDPYKHEIIMTKESEKEEGTILEVVRNGYYFNEYLLRPASVIVAKNNVQKQGE